MTKIEEKKAIISVLTSILTTSISVMNFYKTVALDEKSKEICDKSIKNAEIGIEKIKKIKHIEILRSLFGHIVLGKEPYYAMCGSLCSFEKIDFWDKTKTGFDEFMKLEELGKQEELKKQEEIKKNKEAYYVQFNFESNPETIAELERIYRITDDVLKFITIRK